MSSTLNSSVAPTWNSHIVPVPDTIDGAALLFFSMPGCPWCTKIRPTVESVAAMLGGVVPVYEVKADDPLAHAMGVGSFPTLIYINQLGVPTLFTGDRTVDAIQAFVCNNTSERLSVCSKYRRS